MESQFFFIELTNHALLAAPVLAHYNLRDSILQGLSDQDIFTEAEFKNVQFLQFLGIILRVLRLEVSVYNVYITNQFQTTFAQVGEGG